MYPRVSSGRGAAYTRSVQAPYDPYDHPEVTAGGVLVWEGREEQRPRPTHERMSGSSGVSARVPARGRVASSSPSASSAGHGADAVADDAEAYAAEADASEADAPEADASDADGAEADAAFHWGPIPLCRSMELELQLHDIELLLHAIQDDSFTQADFDEALFFKRQVDDAIRDRERSFGPAPPDVLEASKIALIFNQRSAKLREAGFKHGVSPLHLPQKLVQAIESTQQGLYYAAHDAIARCGEAYFD